MQMNCRREYLKECSGTKMEAQFYLLYTVMTCKSICLMISSISACSQTHTQKRDSPSPEANAKRGSDAVKEVKRRRWSLHHQTASGTSGPAGNAHHSASGRFDGRSGRDESMACLRRQARWRLVPEMSTVTTTFSGNRRG